ncbi:MAG: HlyD family efflux transporter periplasmic adaptor subunit [Chitinophagaceae bacterium]
MQKLLRFFYTIAAIAISACHSQPAEQAAEETEIVTPVTVTGISNEPMAEYIELNATSAYLQKAIIKASANGYITAVNLTIGKSVAGGQAVFIEKTKEAQSIGNTINLLDSSFKFSGIITIRAGAGGYVSEINHAVGDYVQEGEQLAVISDSRSFAFILNMPYELRSYLLAKNTIELLLPDGKKLNASIKYTMPVVDSAAQTQNIILGVNEKDLPVNLIAKVKIEKIAKQNTVSLPKQTVLSDETQSNFWVMKLADSTTAVKVPVKKGIETSERVEILSPGFSSSDLFLLTGNYGLSDTAKVKIEN